MRNRQLKYEYNKAYYAANREKITARNKEWREVNRSDITERRRLAYIRDRKLNLIRACRNRARAGNMPCNITASDLVWPEICPVFGLRLNYETNLKSESSPSLDRLIPNKGYIKGNVVVISLRANRMKNSATPDELRQICDYVFKSLGDARLLFNPTAALLQA
jgi:hypothetical protein